MTMGRRTIFLIFLLFFAYSSLLFGADEKEKEEENKGNDYETLVFLNYGVQFSSNGFTNGTGYNSATLGGITAQAMLIRGYMFGAFFQVGYFFPTGLSTIEGQEASQDTIFVDEIRSGSDISFGATFRYQAQPFVFYVGAGPHIGLAVKNFDTFLNGGLGAFVRFTFTLSKKIRVNLGADMSYNFLGTATTSDVPGTYIHNVTGSLTTGWSYTF